MKNRLVPLLALAALVSACGDDNPIQPTPSQSLPLLSGTVTEPVGIAVRDYSLRIADSERTQVILVDGPDYRVLVQPGPVTLEVTKEGYQPKTASIDVQGNVRHDIEVEPVTPPATFIGPFWMTLIADPATCGALPPDLRTRRYAVDVGQTGVALTLHFSDPALTGQKRDGRIRGSTLSFDLWDSDWFYYGLGSPSIEEKLDDTHRLIVLGSVTGTVSGTGATGKLSGVWRVEENLVAVAAQSCSGVHGVRFDRR